MRTRSTSARPASLPRSARPSAPRAPAKPAPKQPDRFEASAATAHRAHHSAATTRPASEAVSFVAAYDAALGIQGADEKARRQHMTADASSFFQANPALFSHDVQGAFASYADLTGRPAPQVTVDADAHLDNFGSMRGADGKAVWGLNDFDQAAKGSPALDLLRLSASLELRARAQGLSEADAQALVTRIATAYSAEVDRLASDGPASGAYLKPSETKGAAQDLLKKADDAKRGDLLDPLTHGHGDKLRFKHNAELKALSSTDERAVRGALADYAGRLGAGADVAVPLQVLDVVAKKGSGGSSLGLPRYYALVANADPSKKPVVLELKAAPPSPLVDPSGRPSSFDAKQVVSAQAHLGGRLNADTGWTTLAGQSLLVRELEPEKGRVDATQLGRDGLAHLADEAATVLARAHARSPSDARALQAWLGGAPEVAGARLASFSQAYADQVQSDLAAMKR